MNFPTDIKAAAAYLHKAYVERAEFRGADSLALKAFSTHYQRPRTIASQPRS
jgi:hypothetical protein